MSHQKILILDFGSQVSQLIARRVREQQVYCELHPYDVSDAFIREFAPQGIILSGGPNSVYEAEDWRAPEAVFELRANSAMPSCAHAAIRSYSATSRIAAMQKVMACSTCG